MAYLEATTEAVRILRNLDVTGSVTLGDSVTADAHTVSGSMGVTYSGTDAALTVNQQGTGKLFEVQDGGVARVTVLDGGNVGIGTTQPLQALHVQGNAQVDGNATLGDSVTADAHTVSGLMGVTYSGTNAALTVNQQGTGKLFEVQDGGVARVTVLDGGNVGIGTTQPLQALHVLANARVDGNATLGDSVTSDAHTVSGLMGVTYSGTNAALTVNQQGTGKLFEVQDGGVAKVTVLDGGNVGIGLTNPLQKLHIIGNTRIEGDALVTGNWEVQGTTTYIDTYTAVTSNVTIENASGNGPALRVTQSGVGANYPIADFYDSDVSSTVPALRIADGGNVGVGTANPLQKMHVEGSVQATSFIGIGSSLTALNADNVSTGTLAVARGGTGTTTSTGTGSVVLSASPTLTGTVTGGTFVGIGSSLTALNADNVSTGTLAVARGGTGNATYAIGDIIYASGATALTRLADVATGNTLISGGVGVAPAWGKVGLTTHVTGTLAVANGGTGAATTTGNGITLQGNFGQWQGIGTYTDFNTVPAHWGWNYVVGSTNAPNTTSSQWYRGVFSLGSEYPARGAGGYSLELAYPRYSQRDAGVWTRTIENGEIGAWTQVGSKILGNSDVTGTLTITGNVGIGTTNPLAKLHVNGNFYCPGAVVQCITTLYTAMTTYSAPGTITPTEITVLNVTITPKRANSKIVLQWMINGELHYDSIFLVYRDETPIGYNTTSGFNVQWSGVTAPVYDANDQSSTPGNATVNWIDLPNTTAAVKYSVRVRGSGTTAYTLYLGRTVGTTGMANQETTCSTGVAWEICV